MATATNPLVTDAKTAAWLQDIVASENGDREAAVRWLARNMRVIGGRKHWRQAVNEAMEWKGGTDKSAAPMSGYRDCPRCGTRVVTFREVNVTTVSGFVMRETQAEYHGHRVRSGYICDDCAPFE